MKKYLFEFILIGSISILNIYFLILINLNNFSVYEKNRFFLYLFIIPVVFISKTSYFKNAINTVVLLLILFVAIFPSIPKTISNVEDFNKMCNNNQANYYLTNDIDFINSNVYYYENDDCEPFRGVLNGMNYTIMNLSKPLIESTTNSINGTEIKNINFKYSSSPVFDYLGFTIIENITIESSDLNGDFTSFLAITISYSNIYDVSIIDCEVTSEYFSILASNIENSNIRGITMLDTIIDSDNIYLIGKTINSNISSIGPTYIYDIDIKSEFTYNTFYLFGYSIHDLIIDDFVIESNDIDSLDFEYAFEETNTSVKNININNSD